ncbi:MAG: hypothetical protein EBU14_01305 [Acetobacteraceae bacterium]|nr:hypothetical protein [Acetobacteraceae bacterium]
MLVTLSLAAGPGFPLGCVDHRYEIELALDAAGHPDALAWAEDPAPWRARRYRPDAPPEQGDVQYDGDNGWFIRFSGSQAERLDAPEARFDPGTSPIRPGEHVTITEPEGGLFDYRIVAVSAS